MNLDFSPITNSSIYQQDKKKLETTGKKRGLQISLILLAIIIPILWPVLIYVYIKWHSKWKQEYPKRSEALSEFASANGFTFKENMKDPLEGHKPEESYDLPFSVVDIINNNELKGNLLGYPFSYTMSTVFHFKTKQGSKQYPYNLFTIDLPVDLPKVFINSKLNDQKFFDVQAINFKQAEDHKLEGDFPSYYNVRIEKDEQIDMYTILTPEVMDTLKRNNQFDVWLSGNQLTLITFGDLDRYFAATPMVFENAFALMREIDRIARAIRKS